MTELKCPFCDSEIEQLNDQQKSLLHCSNIVCCKGGHYIGNISMWRDLIRTRKALETAKDTLCWYDNNYDSVVARNTLDEIKTTLEQKD